MNGDLAIDLSVVIPTHNRAKSLSNLLQSLRNIDGVEHYQLEIIVVNNDCQDDTARLLDQEQKCSHRYHLRVLEERRRGKSNALNCGLTAARGRVLMVLDDDVTIHPSAIRNHLECYRVGSYDALQGRVLPGVDPAGNAADPRRFLEYNIPHIDYGDGICEIRGLTGTNMSFKREVLDKVGLFDPRLGPGASGFSEDTEYSNRIRNAGFTIGYTPQAIVYHELDPARYGRAYNRRVEFRKGRSRSVYRQDSMAMKVLPNLIANCCRFLIYRSLGKSQKAYKTEGRVMKCWGQLVGTFELRSKRKVSS